MTIHKYLVLVWLLLCIGGCGGGGDAPANPAAQQVQKAMDREDAEAQEYANRWKAATEKKRNPAQKTVARGKSQGDNSQADASEADGYDPGHAKSAKKPSQPTYPADFTKWSPADFAAARSAGDPAIAQALRYRAQHAERTPEEAKMLASLFAAQSESSEVVVSRGSPLKEQANKNSLACAIVAALIANGTPEAKSSLCDLIKGALPAEDERGAVECALAALAREASPEGEDMVVRSILNPEELLFAGRAGLGVEDLRQLGIAALKSEGSSRLRRKLAETAVDAVRTAELRKSLLLALTDKTIVNLDAQIFLYGSGKIDASARASLADHFTQLGKGAVTSIMGLVPPDGSEPVSDANALRVACSLWTKLMSELVDLHLQACLTPAERTPLLRLGATIPNDAMRAGIYRSLGRNWNEGLLCPASTASGGQAVFDPGYLVVLKLVGRDNHRAKPSPPAKPRASSSDSSSKTKDAKDSAKPPIETDWEKTTEDQLRSLCRNCHVAALAQAAANVRDGLPPTKLSDNAFPFKPHAASNPTAVYQFDWPGKWGDRLPDKRSDVWNVSYVRFEERAKPSKPAAYYRKQVKGCEERRVSNGVWFAALAEGTSSQRILSIDVLISRVNSAAGDDDEQPLTVEVLAVEIKDPTS
jgi:hypothetical protein